MTDTRSLRTPPTAPHRRQSDAPRAARCLSDDERANILAFIARDGDGDLAAICAQVLAHVAGILLPHNANPRLRLVTYPCHWTKDREADVVAYIRIGKMAWAVDFR